MKRPCGRKELNVRTEGQCDWMVEQGKMKLMKIKRLPLCERFLAVILIRMRSHEKFLSKGEREHI